MSEREIRGFATVACVGHYREVVSELLEGLLESRLYEKSRAIDLAVLGPPERRQVVEALIRPFEKIRVGYQSEDLREYEFPALGLLQDYSRRADGYVYYLHTKGVSQDPWNQHARYWRALMIHHVIENHDRCREALESHDAAGPNWQGNHYSGNFWWARTEHLRRLPEVEALRQEPRPITSDPVWNLRLQCEFWIGMSAGRFKNFGPQEPNLYRTICWSTGPAELVNRLLAAQGGSRYLEMALEGTGACFAAVSTPVKHLVSPHPEAAFAMTEQDFIESGEGEPVYDVVFIDSSHEEERCLRAIEWALGRVDAQGAIVVHDSNPPTAWHQRPVQEYEPGTDWNGEVWRAVVRFRLRHPEVEVVTVDTDWGCTVIRPGVRARQRLDPDTLGPLTWAAFEENRASWLNLISVRRFHRDLFYLPFALGRTPITSRTDVINTLLSRHGLERYLEIGVAGGEHFAQVIAPIRQGVDPGSSCTFPIPSDEFFARGLGCERYDLIFVDGLHEEEQCLRDLKNALGRLSPGGFIVVHDTNPPTEWHQRPFEQYELGTPWNGTTWKAVVRFRERHPECAVYTVDSDWGCTVIQADPETATAPLSLPADLKWEDFERERKAWLNLKDVEEFRALLLGGAIARSNPAVPASGRRKLDTLSWEHSSQ